MSVDVALDRPLPGDVLRRVRTGLSAYQNYPVFSWPWWRGRTLRFAVITGAIATLLWLVSRTNQPVSPALIGYFAGGFTLIASSGAGLATWVRHRRWPLRREQSMMLGALVVGVLISAGVDTWASAGLDDVLGNHTKQAGDIKIHAAIGVVIYALLGGALAVPRYFTELRRIGELAHEQAIAAVEARHRETDLRLGVLQAQIEPHFLFNTLASAHALIASDPPAAQRLVSDLVSYLRATIPRLRADRLEATLGQQLEICAAYLAVMQTRMGRLSVDIEVADELRDALFPPMLLMTLVENSVKHGIEPRPGPGRITVSAAVRDQTLALIVRDDGAGLRASAGLGLGLVNLRASLHTRYGDRARFELTGGLDGGAAATIELPLERA